MNVAFRRFAGWLLAFLLGSIAGSCSSASKTAVSTAGDSKEETSAPASSGRQDGKSGGADEKQIPAVKNPESVTDPGRIKLMYGVPVTGFRKIEER